LQILAMSALNTPGVVRIAATGDLHYGRYAPAVLHDLVVEVTAAADVFVICGDLTDYGLPDEARGLARELAQVKVPTLAVLGNHDYESGQEADVTAILREAGVIVLDGDSCEVFGVGFAGIKGFCGGFGPRALGSWGETLVKQFVQEALAESLKLETALARLRTPTRLAILHYAPVRDTVIGEPEDIFPFLGSSRLEDPLNRYEVAAVFHGHAHRGALEGRTSTGIPVHNVALPLRLRQASGRPFYLLEVPVPSPSGSGLLGPRAVAIGS
jgi:Icc-related predicted phosphoesterase